MIICKYIIVKTGAILFNENTTHSIVGDGFIAANVKVYSAGFCRIDHLVSDVIPKIKCFGGSESMKLSSIPEIDEQIIVDLFDPVSKIKYFGMMLEDLYNEANG